MSPSYERTGNPEIPAWWWELAGPLLESSAFSNASIAAKASEFAKRESPWKQDAISKFKKGQGQTVELVSGISHALGIPSPFATAPTPTAALEIQEIVRRHQPSPTNPDREGKLAVLDQAAESEIRATRDQTSALTSTNEGRHRGRRSRRPSRGGS